MDLNYESVLWLTPNKVGIRVKDGEWIDKSKENPTLSFTLPKSYPRSFKVISVKDVRSLEILDPFNIKTLEMGYVYFDTITKDLYIYNEGQFINICAKNNNYYLSLIAAAKRHHTIYKIQLRYLN